MFPVDEADDTDVLFMIPCGLIRAVDLYGSIGPASSSTQRRIPFTAFGLPTTSERQEMRRVCLFT